ncbi:L-asparaginase/Glu-tRNA(Gln) amidotransferase subunit D [Duganella sp. HSC-15S17]|uniref:L-asparaginase/Glu-tRNA(Gln) amidotransferase subunit D n=1 Tax=Duganella violaceipulchra TaxID=2849652 RepID=A0ABT1GIK6_9BURK|nr:L-asparaginase/Glu-tRNA(Gln) amidotransferase subunit D [Duganella violaceicalia]
MARDGEANDDELDFVVSDTLNPQEAHILLMLALTRFHKVHKKQQVRKGEIWRGLLNG